VAICLQRGADLHMAQVMPLPLTVSCLGKIQISFTFLVPAHPGSPGQRAVKWVCVYVAYGPLYFATYFPPTEICENHHHFITETLYGLVFTM